MKILKVFLIIFTCLISKKTFGQDHHFTLHNLPSLQINPANTGVFDFEMKSKDLRFASLYREQWRTVSSKYYGNTTPFSTATFSIDAPIKRTKITHRDFGGIGISVLYDKTGDIELKTFESKIYLSYSKTLSHTGYTYLTLGGSGSYTNKSVNISKGFFDNQWNGLDFDPGLSTGENFPTQSYFYKDAHVGLLFQHFPARRNKYSLGFAMHHLLKPIQAFYPATNNQLKITNIIHFKSELKIGKHHDLLPQAYFQYQAKAKELNIGCYYRIRKEGQFQTTVFHELGSGIRTVGDNDNLAAFDACFIAYRLRYGNLLSGISYDINTSSLFKASQTVGSFEISFVYYTDLYQKVKQSRKRAGEYKPKCPEDQKLKRL